MAEQFHVTARKWRPMRFSDVVGQDHVTRTLKNAIRDERLAHAYLFTGQRGCGKTTVARLLAKAINCPNGPKNDYEPCNACENCTAITEGRSMDVSEIDGASNNSVDDVRSMRDNVKYPPLNGKYKVIIIDEVHMLSTSAFNALLKTLEEPPRYLIFIFATTEVQKVLPTILSRTQRYDFRRMQIEEITTRLRLIATDGKITIDDDALLIIAKKADGSMRDAQSIFDQVVAYCGLTVDTNHVREALNLIDSDFYFEVTDAIHAQQASRAFDLSDQIVSKGYDVEEFFHGLLEHFRNILTLLLTEQMKFIEVSKVHQVRYQETAQNFQEGDILRLVRLALNAVERLKSSAQPRVILETTLVEMMLMEKAINIQEILSELKRLNGGGAAGFVAATAPSAPAAAPAVRTESSRPRAEAVAPQAVAPKIETAPVTQTRTADEAEIKSEWRTFVSGLNNRALTSLLEETSVIGLKDGTVYAGAHDSESAAAIKSFTDPITTELRKYFGSKSLLFKIGERSKVRKFLGLSEEDAPPAPKKSAKSHSPLGEALIRELGAQEL